MERRATAKLMRLEMSPVLGKMLKGIPVKLRENVKTDHIYFGVGVAHGLEHLEVEIRVFLHDGVKMASVRVRDKVHIARFGNLKEQKIFAEEATETIFSKMN